MRSLPLEFYSDHVTHQPLKVTLFTRIHELEQIVDQLTQICHLSVEDKQAWLKEHETIVRQLLDKFVEVLPVELEDEKMDQEAINLVVEYTGLLHEMTHLVHNILGTQKNLKG